MLSPGKAKKRVRHRVKPTLRPPKSDVEYDPTALVNARQIAAYYGLSVASVRGWVERGHIVPKVRGYCRHKPSLFLWSEVLALGYAHGADCKDTAKLCPPGHVTCSVAGDRLGLGETHVRRMAGEGKIASVSIRLGGIGRAWRPRHLFFISEEAIEIALAAARAEGRDPAKKGALFTQAVITAVQKPLISPVDEVCLIARRKLWREKNRVWPRKRGFSVADERRAG